MSARIKSFLAFERALDRFDALKGCTDPWQTRSAALNILDIERLASRGDLKRELIKELKHQSAAMERLSLSAKVDHQLLGNIITQQSRMIESLQEAGSGMTQALSDNELLGVLRKRLGSAFSGVPLETNAYQHWLSRPPETHRAALMGWIQPFVRFKQGIDMVLGLMRSSNAAVSELAYQGFFQDEIERDKRFQLLRVTLPASSPYYPEIRVNRNRFSVRFLQPTDLYEHALQIEDDVEFKLTRCGI